MIIRFFFILITIAWSTKLEAGSNVMQLHDATVNSGEVVEMHLEIINDDPFVLFQVSVPLPDGFEFVSGSAYLNPERSNGHQLAASWNENTNVLIMLSFSMGNNTFHGNEGIVASFSLLAPPTGGVHTLPPTNALILNAQNDNIITGTIPATVTVIGPDPQNHTLTLLTEGQGSCYVNDLPYTEPITAPEGTTMQIEAIPDTGWHFQHWAGDHSGNLNPDSITLNNNKTVTAHFAVNTYTITATAGDGGMIDPEGEVPVEHGSNQTFTITPDHGYLIDDVLVDGQSAGPIDQYQFQNVVGPHTIEALFIPKTYTITATAGENGQIEPAGVVTATHGSSLTFNITPDEGYHIALLLIDGEEVPQTDSFTFQNIEQSHTIHAGFDLNMYTITATAGHGGNIQPAGQVAVAHGANRTFHITPNTGYHIQDVVVDNSSVGAVSSYTFTHIEQDHTIHATFLINTYILMYEAGQNGNLLGDTLQEVIHGNDGSPVEAIPEHGYHFAQWSDGITDNPRTDTNVTAGLSVTAQFAPNIYTLLYIAGENGTINGLDQVEQHVQHGHDGIPAEAMPNQGYHFTQWSDGLTENPRTETNVTADLSITAHFAINTFSLFFDISNNAGEPLEDAVITLNGEEYPPGNHHFHQLPPDTYIYMVSCNGYFDAHGEAEITDADKTQPVVMQPDDTGLPYPQNITFSVYPNPAHNYFTVTAGKPMTSISLVNLHGKIVYRAESGQTVHQIPLADIPAGTYIISVVIDHLRQDNYRHQLLKKIVIVQ